MVRLVAVAFVLAFASSAQAMSPALLHQPDGMTTQAQSRVPRQVPPWCDYTPVRFECMAVHDAAEMASACTAPLPWSANGASPGPTNTIDRNALESLIAQASPYTSVSRSRTCSRSVPRLLMAFGKFSSSTSNWSLLSKSTAASVNVLPASCMVTPSIQVRLMSRSRSALVRRLRLIPSALGFLPSALAMARPKPRMSIFFNYINRLCICVRYWDFCIGVRYGQ